jgi:hypothetical protein
MFTPRHAAPYQVQERLLNGDDSRCAGQSVSAAYRPVRFGNDPRETG